MPAADFQGAAATAENDFAESRQLAAHLARWRVVQPQWTADPKSATERYVPTAIQDATPIAADSLRSPSPRTTVSPAKFQTVRPNSPANRIAMCRPFPN